MDLCQKKNLFGLFYAVIFIWFRECDWKIGSAVAIGDVVHQLLEKAGLIYAGSALYIIVGSTSIAWTALFSRYYLKKSVSVLQWAGIILVTLGLSLRSTMVEFSFSNNEFIGILLVTVAAIMHALCYVIQEKLMTNENPIEGANLVCIMGCVNGALLVLWTLFYTAPRWDELVSSRVREREGSWSIVFIATLLLVIAAFARSTVLSWVLRHMGAISASVLKGARPVVVFSLSHILFCATHEAQCMNGPKLLTAIVCSLGFTLFTAARSEPLEKVESQLRNMFGLRSLQEIELELKQEDVEEREERKLLVPASKDGEMLDTADESVKEAIRGKKVVSERASVDLLDVGNKEEAEE